MKSNALAVPRWSTATFGREVCTSPMELSALNEHLRQCNAQRGVVFRMRCAAETLNAFIGARFMTTLSLLALPILLLSAFL